MANIFNAHITATADMSQAKAQVTALEAAFERLRIAASLVGKVHSADAVKLNKIFSSEVRSMNEALQASGRYRVHTLGATTATEQLGERLTKNKATWKDFTSALRGATKAGSIYQQLGLKQAAMESARAIKVGQTTYVYEKLTFETNKNTQAAIANAYATAGQNAALSSYATRIINFGKNTQWAGRQLTMGLTYPMTLFGAAAAKVFKDIDINLTRLAKVYGVGLSEPTNRELDKIRENVIGLSKDLATELGISAKETTEIAAEFAAAGMQGEQLLAATKQAARIVVLGEADKQEAVKATISLQTAYKLNTDELTEAVNFFNAAQAATSTNMQDLIGAIPRVGPVIKNLGGSYKDMVAILTALKEGGVPAGEAANAIKNSLSRIINPTKAAKNELMNFGIDIESIVNRNAGDLTSTIAELQEGLLKLDELSRQRAISELFGKYQASRLTAFIENFNQAGSQSVKIIEMMGLAPEELANIAEKQTERIQQSASMRFKIALETFKTSLIPIGESFLNTVTSILGVLNDLVKTINNLPQSVKSFLKMMAGFTMIIGPFIMFVGLFGNLIGNILKGIVGIKILTGAMRALFGEGGRQAAGIIFNLSRSFEMVTAAATAAKNPVDLFAAAGVDASSKTNGLTASVDHLIERLLTLIGVSDASVTSIASVGQAASGSAAALAVAGGPTTGTLVGSAPVGRQQKGKGKKGPRTGGKRVNYNRRVPVVPPIQPPVYPGAMFPARPTPTQRLNLGLYGMGFTGSKLGMAAGMGGMGAFMAGSPALGMGLSAASMVPMMMAGSSALMMTGVMGLVAAIPVLIKLMLDLKQKSEDAAEAIGNRFGSSAAEAELFGIKIQSLSEMSLPELTESQKNLNDKLKDYAEKIKNLEEKDPLRLFAESLKEMSLENRLKALQEKYLTLRIQGVSDEDARNIIQSILKAGGVETGTLGVAPKLSEVSARSTSEILALQQRGAVEAAGSRFIGQTYYVNGRAQGTANEVYRKVVMENAQTLGNYVVNGGMEAVRELSKLSASYKKGSEELIFFNQSVRKMYQDSGIGTAAFERFKQSGASTSEILTLFRLRMNGTISTVEQWDRALKDSAYRLSITQAEEAKAQITEAYSELSSGLGKVLETTTARSAGPTSRQIDADAQINKQKSLVDRLKEELDLRKKILDAQNKSNEFAMSQANLQQKYNEALASGNLGEAAQIQRQMTIEQGKYNQELALTAKQNRIDLEEKRLKALEERKKKVDSQVAASTKKTETTIDSVNNKYSEMIKNLLTQGKDVSSTINTWASELQSKFGGNLDKIKNQLNSFVDSIKVADLTTIGGQMASAFDKILGKAQQLNVVNAANNLLLTGKAVTIPEAYTMALQDIMGKKMVVEWNTAKGGFDIFQRGTGTGRSDAGSSGVRTFIDMFDLTQNPANRAMGGIVKKYGMGGKVRYYGPGSWGGVWGPGTSTSDSIPAMLSNGEYVVNAAAVSKVGTQFMDQLNSLGYANSAPLMSIISATGSPVIPVQVVPSSNGGSMYNDHSTINVYVSQTNATANDIANAVHGAIQRRENMTGSRTVIG